MVNPNYIECRGGYSLRVRSVRHGGRTIVDIYGPDDEERASVESCSKAEAISEARAWAGELADEAERG